MSRRSVYPPTWSYSRPRSSSESYVSACEGVDVFIRSGFRFGLEILLQPTLYFSPPQSLVLRLSNPMALVGEHHQPARHVHALERGEHRQVLGIRHAVVELTTRHERRRLEVLHVEMRRVDAI